MLTTERKKLEKEIVDAPTQEEAIKISDKNEPRLDEISAEESKLLNEKQELEADKVQLSRNR